MHAFDWLVWRRCLGLALLLTLLTAGVAAATDEPGSTLGTRLARLAAFLPAVVVIAQAIVIAQSRERGEIGALAALGASPLRRVRGAILAGLSLGALAVLALISPWSDVSALFPVVGAATSFTDVGTGLEDPATGALYSPDGSISFGAADEPASSGLTAPSRVAGLGFVAPLTGRGVGVGCGADGRADARRRRRGHLRRVRGAAPRRRQGTHAVAGLGPGRDADGAARDRRVSEGRAVSISASWGSPGGKLRRAGPRRRG